MNYVLRIGNAEFNPTTGDLIVGEKHTHLSRKLAIILKELVAKSGRMISRDQLMIEIYDDEQPDGDKILDVFVCNLRKNMKKIGCTATIQTCFGDGFAMASNETDAITCTFTPDQWRAVQFAVSFANGHNNGLRERTGIRLDDRPWR